MELFLISIAHTNKERCPTRCSVLANSEEDAIDGIVSLGFRGSIQLIVTLSDIHSPDDLNKKSSSLIDFIMDCLTLFIYRPYGLPTWTYKQYNDPNIRLLNYAYKAPLSIYTVDHYLNQNDESYVKSVIGVDNGVCENDITIIPYFYRVKINEGDAKIDISPLTSRNEKFIKCFLFPKSFSINDIQRMVFESVHLLVRNKLNFYVTTDKGLYRIVNTYAYGIQFDIIGY